MRARLKAGIPGNKIMRGDFKWERALEIVQEVFVDSLHQAKQHQDFRGFGQGRGGHGYKTNDKASSGEAHAQPLIQKLY